MGMGGGGVGDLVTGVVNALSNFRINLLTFALLNLRTSSPKSRSITGYLIVHTVYCKSLSLSGRNSYPPRFQF